MSLILGIIAASIFLRGNTALGQPAITNIYPDGVYQFEPSATLTFVASSSAGITNVSVTLTPTTLEGQQGFPKTLSNGQLAITGPSTGETVSTPLTSNTLYTAAIHVTDG
ncbi:MAG: hypothetical protein ACREFE_19435, partial [Limisphaerales bacterium]